MPPCEVVLKAQEDLCDGTAAFFFEKPAGFEFKAGQFANFTLLNGARTDGERNTRSFSIASAPREQDLMVAMRMRDTAFKRALAASPVGAHVLFQGPFGNLTLHGDAARPAVFLAGGIGITPFRSMLRHATEAQSPHKIFLFYSFRRPEEAAFLEELRRMESFNSGYGFIPTATQPAETKLPWQGETGYISQEMLARHVGDLKGPIYYIAGPPAMVAGMRQTLSRAGVPDDDIRAEEFAGYQRLL